MRVVGNGFFLCALLGCGILMGALPSPARADTIYSNLGPGDSFDGGIGWTVSASQPQDPAMPFTVPGIDYQFTSVELALFGSPPSLDILLMTDAGGPGAVIETITIAVPGVSTLVTATSVLLPTLTAGTTYWIATDASGGFEGGWNWTSPQVFGNTAFSFNQGATWNVFPGQVESAYRVSGNPVAAIPEPATIVLAGLGGLCLLGRQLRRRVRA